MTEPLACLFDANNYIFRAYYGLPPMQAPDGTPMQATYGFTRTVLKVLRQKEPAFVVACFEAGPSFRNQLYADYKANRAAPPDDLIPQFATARAAAAAIGIACIECPGYEADDLLGTLARRLRAAGVCVAIVSGDKDLAQVVGDGITLLDVAHRRELDAAGVEEIYGIRPDQVADYLALTGDSVDNIPGVSGVGPKTARALLRETDSLDALLAAPERIEALPVRGRHALRARIAAAAEQLQLSRRLATIRYDVPLELDLEAIAYRGASRSIVEREFELLGFGRRIQGEINRWVTEAGETGRLDL